MSTKLSIIAADFTTSLSAAMAIGATTATLQSATDDDGVVLATGTYYLTIDGTNSQKEHIQCTLTATALTAIKSVSRQGVIASGCVRPHRTGSPVALTDFATLRFLSDLLRGATDLDSSNPLKYDGTATISNANQLATKAYVDGVAIAGAPDATTAVKGIVKMSTAPASATSPIAVGDNDTRVSTQGENDAQVGNNIDVAVGTGNKFVTQTGLQHNAEKYAADTSGSSTAYVITLSPVPTSYTTGMVIYAKIVSANTTTTPTLNVNGLGAKTIVKFASTALAVGDIAANTFNAFIYDGTNLVLQSPVAVQSTFKSGTTSKTASDASTTQTIAHGLGVTPKYVRISAMATSAAGSGTSVQAITTYNGTTQSSVSLVVNSTLTTSFNLNSSGTDATYQTGVVTFDATNITITWTKTGGPNGVFNLLWEAFA